LSSASALFIRLSSDDMEGFAALDSNYTTAPPSSSSLSLLLDCFVLCLFGSSLTAYRHLGQETRYWLLPWYSHLYLQCWHSRRGTSLSGSFTISILGVVLVAVVIDDI
ncbi:MAG: hypothetical protein ACJ71G_19000, partial [Nitrososphaeraceae archaeon]